MTKYIIAMTVSTSNSSLANTYITDFIAINDTTGLDSTSFYRAIDQEDIIASMFNANTICYSHVKSQCC